MAPPLTSHRKADALSSGIFLIGLGVLLYFSIVWPAILLLIGASLMIRQYLRGRYYDMGLTTVLFGGLFAFYFFAVSWNVLVPVLFTLGGLYIIFREYFINKERVGDEEIEDKAKEIEDDESDVESK